METGEFAAENGDTTGECTPLAWALGLGGFDSVRAVYWKPGNTRAVPLLKGVPVRNWI